MDTELEPVPISALEHYSYCRRKCALIHVEQVFDDNVFTVRGILNHERVHEPSHEARSEIRREYGLPIWSDRLGLVGKADVVEFREERIYPIEHKSGRKRAWAHEAIQLCAQALCLEEMLDAEIRTGAVYYHGSRTRREIEFDSVLRKDVVIATNEVREMLTQAKLPLPSNDARCLHCSLWDRCLPGISGQRRRVGAQRSMLYRLLS